MIRNSKPQIQLLACPRCFKTNLQGSDLSNDNAIRTWYPVTPYQTVNIWTQRCERCHLNEYPTFIHQTRPHPHDVRQQGIRFDHLKVTFSSKEITCRRQTLNQLSWSINKLDLQDQVFDGELFQLSPTGLNVLWVLNCSLSTILKQTLYILYAIINVVLINVYTY